MKKWILLLIQVSVSCIAISQEKVLVEIQLMYGKSPISIHQSILTENGSTIRLKKAKLYLSNLALYEKNTLVWNESSSYHLIDFSSPASVTIPLSIPESLNYDQLDIGLGIDSLTNVSGILQGDLDPIHGMYWTWQSGYINFKLEGSIVNQQEGKTEFQHHIGGYLPPYTTYSTSRIEVVQGQDIQLYLNIKKYLENQFDHGAFTLMSPGKSAQEASHEINKTITSHEER